MSEEIFLNMYIKHCFKETNEIIYKGFIRHQKCFEVIDMKCKMVTKLKKAIVSITMHIVTKTHS